MVQKKVMLLGDIGVGKSSIARRLVFGSFDGSYKTTIGVDIFSYELPPPIAPTGGMRMSIWDTDGEFGIGIFETMYIRGASAALVVADVTRPASVEKMQRLVSVFQERMPGRPIVPLLNKTDLAAADVVADIATRIDSRGDGVRLTSALSGEGITDSFGALARLIIQRGQ